MALIPYDAPLLRQPSGLVRINEKHWLARDLVFAHSGLQAFVFGAPAPRVVESLSATGVDGSANPALNNVQAWAPDGANYSIYPLLATVALPLTLSAWWHGTTGTAAAAIVGVRRNGANPGGVQLQRSTNERAEMVAMTSAAGSTATVSVTGSFLSGRWQHGAAVFIAADNRTVYADGGYAAQSTLSRAFPTDCTEIILGGSVAATPVAADAVVAAFAFPLVLGRALAADEVARLHDEQRSNPWVLFAERPIWVPVSSGYTHPTLSNARMTSLTSTTGVPAVDYAF